MKEREEGRMEGKGENGIVEGTSDCEDERARLRPADIDADVREMERRKRVESMMSSRLFREELERIVEAQMRDGAAAVGPLLQQIQDMIQTGPARAHNSFSVKSTNCVIPINDIRGVESMGYAKGEKLLRCKLAAIYRLMDLYGWTQGINNHITGRLNQEEELLLVNAYGMLYHEVTASSLVKIDMQGNVVEPGTTNFGVNVQGFHLHAAIHQARPDIKCIIHVHTPSVLAVSSLKAGLLPLSNESVVVGEVSVHQSTGSLQEPEEKDKLARNLGPINKVMLLSNNGAVCCGETVEEAFFNVYNTVLACESQMKVMPLGVDNLVLMQDEARKAIYDVAHKVPESTALPSTTGQPSENKEKRWRIGGLHFEALMRMLDNAGFRTGYIYRTPLVKGEPPKPRSDVEVPPAVSSLGYLLEEEEMYRNWKKMGATKNDRTRWLNSPNVYQKVEILETGTPDPKKITKWVDANAEEWVADGSPTHSSTPVKISDALQFVPKNTNPKEFKKLQQQIKENRRADKITSGPQSHILEGVSWEEAKKLQDANMSGAGDQVVLVGAASKGIIQREFQHNATVYKTPYAKNPFDSVSAQEIEDYKKTVQRKQRGESYDEDQSESEALSSSAALPPSGFKSPPSETDDDSRTEPRVLRIETKTAPIPSQAEYVLSDDCRRTSKATERIRCYSRVTYTPSPCQKEKPIMIDVSTLKNNSNQFINNNQQICSNCNRMLNQNMNVLSRGVQTVLSINEIEDENLCQVERNSPLGLMPLSSCIDRKRKRPVARRLTMDAVIDELKDKFRSIGCYNRINFKEYEQDLDKERNENNSEEDELQVTSYTLYKIPNTSQECFSLNGNDFTSEETTTNATNSSSTDDILQGNNEEHLEEHIGDHFEGGESLSEKPSSPEHFDEDQITDSFLLSDLLSKIHINITDGDSNSSCSDDVAITIHTNKTKRAVLLKNNRFSENSYRTIAQSKKTPFYNSFHKLDSSNSAHSTSSEESFLNAEEVDATVLYSDTNLENNNNIIECYNNEELHSICQKHDNTQSLSNYDQLDCSNKEENNNIIKYKNLKLTIDGKGVYEFYKEFDPNEVFQNDSDNFSMKAFYDNQSLLEHINDDCALASISGEDSVESVPTTHTPILVNENIFTGKRYLLKRYLIGDEDNHTDVENFLQTDGITDKFKECNEKEINGNELCCTISEDSAVFSGLTNKVSTKGHLKGSIVYDHIVDWNLSNSSKEGSSIDSSNDSSGVRMSYASDEEIPDRQPLSSIDEFLIKESICDAMPHEPSSLNNSHLSFPAKETMMNSSYYCNISKSLPNIHLNYLKVPIFNIKNCLKLNTYKLPDLPTIRSYYTLVSYLDKNVSMPDLNYNPLSFKVNSFVSDVEDNVFIDERDNETTLNEEYNRADFACMDSESDISDMSHVLHFINENDKTVMESRYIKNHNFNTICDVPSPSQTNYKSKYDENNAFKSSNNETDENIEDHSEQLNCSETTSHSSINKYVIDAVIKSPMYLTQQSEDQMQNINPFSRFIKPQCNYDYGHLTTCDNGFDCLKCYAASMDDAINLLPTSENQRNKIISALKKKFSKHNCISKASSRPKKLTCKKQLRSRKINPKFDFNVDVSEPSSSQNMLSFKSSQSDYVIPYETKSNTQPDIYPSFYSLDCESNQNGTHSRQYEVHQSEMPSAESEDDTIVSDKLCLEKYCIYRSEQSLSGEDYEEESSSSLSSKNFNTILTESYFSVQTSSRSSDPEYYSVISDANFKSIRSSSNSTDGSMLPPLIKSDCSEESFSRSDYKLNLHDIAFITDSSHDCLGEDCSCEFYNYRDSYGRAETTVSSVSCQTDESFDSFSTYQPEDYSDSSPRDSEETSNDSSDSSLSPNLSDIYLSHTCETPNTSQSSYELYTIYENPLEITPEY